jgi:AhpD family alkylhydroperoxidase
MGKYDEFSRFRQRLNEKILAQGNLGIKRFFALDEQAYKAGALDGKTKELLGLTASLVLRCDDCVAYHIIQAKEFGTGTEEFFEVFNIALIVGGSIVIPHLRRAVDFLEDLEKH